MRICFISVGAFSHVGSYIDYFRDAGHDVHFIALSPSPPRSVPTYDVGLGGVYDGVRGKWKYPCSMLRARRLVRRLKPDIVHAHYATSGGLAGLVCGFHPSVVTVHGTDLTAGMKSRTWRLLLKAVFRRANCVNTVSEDLRSMALSLGADPAKVRALTPGVDTGRFEFAARPAVSDAAAVRLICTRRLDAELDPLTIVRALAILKRHAVKFKMTFAAGGRLRGELESLTARLGLSRDVAFLGGVANAAMPALLREHDVYLSASLWDGTSLSLLEAMSSGLFPVVSGIRANSAWVQHGIGGFLHRPGDPDHLAECVMKLARCPQLAGTAAELNRGKVVAAGDRTTNMRRLEAIYLELVEAARGA